MAFFINAKCTSCKACVEPCPTQSIFYGIEQHTIDSDTCDECQICVQLCPEDAIKKIED